MTAPELSEHVTLRCARLSGASAAVLAGVRADLAFCHPAIQEVTRLDPDSATLELAVDPAVAGDGADLTQQVQAVVGASVASYRFVPQTPALWQRTAGAALAGLPALAAFTSRFLRPLGPGQWALVGPAARLRAALDARVSALAAQIDAEPWHLPSIEMAADLLPATGYLSSHPQHVTFGYHLPPHFAQLRDFAAKARSEALAVPADPCGLQPTGFILEPFVCHNVYRALRGARLASGQAITALGNAYRYEGHRFEPLLRQWEFSMREVVLVGSAEYVARQRQRMVELTQGLAEDLDLAASLEIATDPFFVSEAGSARAFQLLQSTKLELRLGLDERHATAAASFNLHARHFTTPLDIRGVSDGDARGASGPELLETACVGWGLERWMAAFVARWGAEPADWPGL